MSKTLIFSDLHLRHRQIDPILSLEEPYDRVIWLGDYFDQYNDTAAQNADAARWVKEKMGDQRNIFLVGNHDLAYICPANNFLYCSGATPEKTKAIRDILSQEYLDRFLPWHIDEENQLLFSHAGLDSRMLSTYLSPRGPLPKLALSDIRPFLDSQGMSQFHSLSYMGKGSLFGCGFDRCGYEPLSGVTWVDFGSIQPISAIGQIVGHTIQNREPNFKFAATQTIPQYRRISNGVNEYMLSHGFVFCLDTNNHHYGVLDNGILNIKQIKWHQELGSGNYYFDRIVKEYKVKLN